MAKYIYDCDGEDCGKEITDEDDYVIIQFFPNGAWDNELVYCQECFDKKYGDK